MVSQIFKDKIPFEIVEDFIKKNSILERDKYMFNKYCFKKISMKDELDIFLKKLLPYYHISKKYYVEREMSYIRFATILRQLCNLHKIQVVSKIKYFNSSYENVYFIDLTNLMTITSK
jgi:hypothetical protein